MTIAELNTALDQLQQQGHRIGTPFAVDEQIFVVVDDVALAPRDADRLAKGQVTINELRESAPGDCGRSKSHRRLSEGR